MSSQVRHDHPLRSQAFRLEFPQSLGTFREYYDVQKLVDTLADNDFPVQNTMIVGTDLKLIERVTGKKSWGRVIVSGMLSGAWMGLFIGLLLSLFTEQWLTIIAQSVLMGAVFFTVWAVIGHAMSGGQRDFTSMTTTVPMQYELLVEHRHVMQARRILSEAGLPLGPGAFAQAPPTNKTESSSQPDTDERQRPTYGLPGQQ